MDPYRVLGVRRNAGHAAIKRAFRARVKHAHPDHGGNVDEFLRLHAAYRVLSNPARRRRYDETGQVDEETGPGHSRAVSLVVQAFDGALEQCARNHLDPVQQDLVAMMRAILERSGAKVAEQANQASRSAEDLRRLLGRFERGGDDENLMDEMIAARVAKLEETARNISAEGAAIGQALELLAAYRFRREVMQQLVVQTWSTTGASTTAAW